MRPDANDVVGQVSDVFRRNLRRIGPIVIGVIAVLIALSSVYKVGPGEQGVVRTFGRETGKTGPGLHFAVPFVQRVNVVNVEQVRRVEVGFRGKERVHNEALMITGDENIVEAQCIVQYRITDPTKHLFRLLDPEETLRAAAEVALRGMVGRTTIDNVMTTGREKVQAETQAWLQKLMDTYESGLTITEVKLQVVDAPDDVREAFHDVVRAREEKEQKINQAMGYQADVIPRARGESQKIAREAEAYKEQRVLRANGDVAKFQAVLAEYRKGERVTRERLHLETMERILKAVPNKVIVDGEVARNALPVLPLGPLGPSAVGAGQAGGR
ncbi:MAG: FtsH protease activity modulator HflK [Polyangiaceae bacterium]|jgi:membrane protease subunit HflK|nr:FtsH protease activity modulator HflK [Polyangiaceae bacterium]